MFLTIVRKGLLANILAFKFLTGFVLCVVLIASSAYLLTKSYEERLRNYNDSMRKHQAELRAAMVYSEVGPTLDKQPESLSIFCEGFDGKLGNTVSISLGEVPREATGRERRDNIFLVSPSLDFVSIVTVVLSLFALLASYDAISGENEDGTLKLMLSNAVSRNAILIGKYLGGMLSLIPSLLCSFILALPGDANFAFGGPQQRGLFAIGIDSWSLIGLHFRLLLLRTVCLQQDKEQFNLFGIRAFFLGDGSVYPSKCQQLFSWQTAPNRFPTKNGYPTSEH